MESIGQLTFDTPPIEAARYVTPRPYQRDAIMGTQSGWCEFTKQLGVAPTGSGKTLIAAQLAKERFEENGERTLFLAHRDDLIEQAERSFRSVGFEADIEKAEQRAGLLRPVISTIQTMQRRYPEWPKTHFGLIICDEAHLSLAPSWQEVLAYFDADVLGITATADLGEKKNLGSYYQNLAFEINRNDLVRQGYLAPFSMMLLPVKIDMGNVGSRFSAEVGGQDYNVKDVSSAIEPHLDEIAKQLKLKGGNRKILGFTPLIDTARKAAIACQNVGLAADFVYGQDPDRAAKRDKFRTGGIKVLWNSLVYSVGFDEPSVDAICNLRLTRSHVLGHQIHGRGSRIFPGKKDCLVFDFLFANKKHLVFRPANLIAADEVEAEEMEKMAEKQGALPADVASQMPLDIGLLQAETQRKREAALRKALEEVANRRAKFISAEQFALDHGKFSIAEFKPAMPWEMEAPTDAQVKLLERAKINPDTVRGTRHAAMLLGLARHEVLATPKQRRFMAWKGWRSDDGLRGGMQATHDDAIKFFSRLSKEKRRNA